VSFRRDSSWKAFGARVVRPAPLRVVADHVRAGLTTRPLGLTLMKLLFKLDCGRTVKEALHCCRTYGGLIEGRPNAYVNQQIMEEARGQMGRVWGPVPRRIHVVPPVIDESDPRCTGNQGPEHNRKRPMRKITAVEGRGSSDPPVRVHPKMPKAGRARFHPSPGIV
jgi:hypothetical protein